MSDNAMENFTLGKWRIAGIPPAPKGEHRVRVNIRLGVDGSVGLDATLKRSEERRVGKECRSRWSPYH